MPRARRNRQSRIAIPKRTHLKEGRTACRMPPLSVDVDPRNRSLYMKSAVINRPYDIAGTAPVQPRPLLPWVCVSIAFGVLLWSYWPALSNLVAFWQSNPDYSAGMFVPLVAIYIVWGNRHSILQSPRQMTWWGFPALLVAQTAGLIGILYKYDSLERYSLVLTVAAACLLFLGFQTTRRLVWPLVFLMLMMPLPGRVHNAISLPLQTLATGSAVFGLECLGYLVSREGNVLRLSDQTTLAVAEACSGLRMLTAFIIVSSTLAFIVPRPRWQKAVLVLSSIPIAIIGNTLRLIVTAIVFERLGGETARSFLHDFAGLAMMPVACATLLAELWIMRRFGATPAREASSTRSNSKSARSGSARAAYLQLPGVLRTRPLAAAVVLLCCAGAGRHFVQGKVEAAMGQMLPLSQPLSTLPLKVGLWEGRDLSLDDDVRQMTGDDDFINRVYTRSDLSRSVRVYVGYIGRPRARMGHRPDICYPAQGFQETAKEMHELRISNGSTVPSVLYEFSAPLPDVGRDLVLATFLINGRFTSDVLQVNSYNTRNPGLLSRRDAYVARVQLSLKASGDRVADVALLSDFAEHSLPLITAAMPVVSP